MFDIRLADVVIRIKNKYEYIENMCREYKAENDVPDFEVSVSYEEIEEERSSETDCSGYLESLAVYRKIAENIIDFNAFLLHGAILDCCGTGIAFLAKSGIGKTTHITLWKKLLDDKITVINGDKPLVRNINGTFYAYGTPWAGKEGWQTNSKTELKKICFFMRGEENKIEPTDKKDVLNSLISQIYIPKNNNLYFINLLDLIGGLIENADFYRLWCNMDISAAKIAYEGMFYE